MTRARTRSGYSTLFSWATSVSGAWAFTITGGKVITIEMIADPERIGQLDLIPC